MNIIKILGKMPSMNINGTSDVSVGTLHVPTALLATSNTTHADSSRILISTLNIKRAEQGLPTLTSTSEEYIHFIKNCVELTFIPGYILIRPIQNNMELVEQADNMLQLSGIAMKHRILFDYLGEPEVLNFFKKKGICWRLRPFPSTPSRQKKRISESHRLINDLFYCFYNSALGIRYLTYTEFSSLEKLPHPEFLKALKIIQHYLDKKNRHGYHEMKFFLPLNYQLTNIMLHTDFSELSIQDLHTKFNAILTWWEKSAPEPFYLHDDLENPDWLEEMVRLVCTSSGIKESDFGLGQEFMNNVTWLPGGSFKNGFFQSEILSSTPYKSEYLEKYGLSEAAFRHEIDHLTDPFAEALIRQMAQQYASLEYINIGRVRSSMSLRLNRNYGKRHVYVLVLRESEPDYKHRSSLPLNNESSDLSSYGATISPTAWENDPHCISFEPEDSASSISESPSLVSLSTLIPFRKKIYPRDEEIHFIRFLREDVLKFLPESPIQLDPITNINIAAGNSTNPMCCIDGLLANAIYHADIYADNVMERRLAARQLGMKLAEHVSTQRVYVYNEKFRRHLPFIYCQREYINGIATDKIPAEMYHTPMFVPVFGELLGRAAASNIMAGRAYFGPAAPETPNSPLIWRTLFDDSDEIMVLNQKTNLPAEIVLGDLTGSFMDCDRPMSESIQDYAMPVIRRTMPLPDEKNEPVIHEKILFARVYLRGFFKQFKLIQSTLHKTWFHTDPNLNIPGATISCPFRSLFQKRHGSKDDLPQRWERILNRLANTNLDQLFALLRNFIARGILVDEKKLYLKK